MSYAQGAELSKGGEGDSAPDKNSSAYPLKPESAPDENILGTTLLKTLYLKLQET